MSQTWDYKIILRRRGVSGSGLKIASVTAWEVFEDGNVLADGEVLAIAKRLGAEGWELLSVVPRASIVEHASVSIAGVTTEELWVYKRAIK